MCTSRLQQLGSTVLKQVAGCDLYYELLAEQGAGDAGTPDVLQVLEAALEVLAVREHTQAGSSARLIRLCNLHQHFLNTCQEQPGGRESNCLA